MCRLDLRCSLPAFSTRKLQEREDDSLLQMHHVGQDECTPKHADPFATSSRVPSQQSRVFSAAFEASLRKIVVEVHVYVF